MQKGKKTYKKITNKNKNKEPPRQKSWRKFEK
jgi:hypothetical protein